jgi:AraC family transcriptional regulator, arabinose operon regulatory protein
MHEEILYFPPNLDLPFVIDMAGTSDCDGSYRIRRQKSNVAVFEYIVSGKGTVQEDDKSCIAGPGDVYILHQECRHDYYADASDPWVKVWFNIRGPLVRQLLQVYHLDDVNLVRSCSPSVAGLFQQFLENAGTNQPYLSIFAECSLIFHRILIQLHQHTTDESSSIPGELQKAQSFILKHLSEKIGLTDIARSIFRSPAYTVRLFKSAAGLSPYAWLQQRRLEAARRLLSETHLPIRSISDQLMFADQQYFATVFHRATGLSPSDYRKSSRGGGLA